MKKNVFLFIMIFFISISCINTINAIDDKKVNEYPKVVASIPEENIYVYATSEDVDGFYRGLILSINGKKKYFKDWVSLTYAFAPELHYLDLNNDNKKELVIILYENEGTGMVRRIAHIINPKDFTEYKVKSALDIINDDVKTKIVSPKEITMKINDNIYDVKIGNVPYNKSGINPSKVKKIYYEDYIKYYFEDNILKAKVGVEVSTLMYLGYIIIDYDFIDGEFKNSKITFEPRETVKVTPKITK